MLKDALPHAGLGPAAETPMDVLPVTEALRQVAPGHAGAIAIQHGLDEQAIVRRGHPDRSIPTWQKVLDPVPLVVT